MGRRKRRGGRVDWELAGERGRLFSSCRERRSKGEEGEKGELRSTSLLRPSSLEIRLFSRSWRSSRSQRLKQIQALRSDWPFLIHLHPFLVPNLNGRKLKADLFPPFLPSFSLFSLFFPSAETPSTSKARSSSTQGFPSFPLQTRSQRHGSSTPRRHLPQSHARSRFSSQTLRFPPNRSKPSHLPSLH